jgi:hypothetical protein
MSERKNLTITQVEEIKRVGDKQIPKLSFRAREGDSELAAIYFTFKSSLFPLIKEGQTINADVEIEQKGEYTNRKIVQIYVGGQPVSVKSGYHGKSPEELELSARSYALSYAKDLAVSQLTNAETAELQEALLRQIIPQADLFYNWLKKNCKAPETKLETEIFGSPEVKSSAPSKIQNITEFKGLMADYKIGTPDVKEILNINKLDEIKDFDKAWEQIKKAKNIKP